MMTSGFKWPQRIWIMTDVKLGRTIHDKIYINLLVIRSHMNAKTFE